jgi:hypothetical protein
MKYNFRKLITYKIILLILLLFILFFLIYGNYKTVTEGFNDTPEGRTEANRFKMENIDNVIPADAMTNYQIAVQSSQNEVDNYLNSKNYAPVNNDDDVKTAISILYNDMNIFTSTFSKFYFIASAVPIFFESFVYDENKLSVQYNALLKCYPKTIKNGDDYRGIYSIIILAQISNDIVNSELNPKPGTIDGTQVNYYGYITDPILNEIKTQLEYFYNKL